MTDSAGTAVGGTPIPQCRWCGLFHGHVCPYVKAIDFHADGVTVKRVEFHEPKPLVAATGPITYEPGVGSFTREYTWKDIA